jgi:hypothetical protein
VILQRSLPLPGLRGAQEESAENTTTGVRQPWFRFAA